MTADELSENLRAVLIEVTGSEVRYTKRGAVEMNDFLRSSGKVTWQEVVRQVEKLEPISMQAIVERLAGIGGGDAILALRQLATWGGVIAFYALPVIARVEPNFDTLKLIQSRLRESNPQVVAGAANAAEITNNPAMVPVLRDVLRPRKDFAQSYVASALLKLAKAEALPDLIPLMQSSDGETRTIVVIAIVRYGINDQLAPLSQAIRDGYREVRPAITREANNHPRKELLPYVLRLAQDADLFTQRDAKEAIEKIMSL